MQYILSEEEYNKLIHKERIRTPIKEFTESLQKALKDVGGNKDVLSPHSHFIHNVRGAIATLAVKLDL